MKRTYHIRFNTQHEGSGWVWRIIDGTVEHLARHVSINVPSKDSVIITNSGETKWNICCEGYLTIDSNGLATISDML